MGTDIHSVIQVKYFDTWKTFGPWYEDRNYSAFALLANVRNEYTDTSDKPLIPYIQENRGFPEGFDENIKYVCRHDRGWVTARELSEYDYGIKIPRNGVITAEEFLERDRKGITERPNIWFANVLGNGIHVVDEREYWRAIEDRNNPVTHVRISWADRLHEMLGADFLNAVLYAGRLGLTHGMDNVRAIFGFSS